MNSILQGLLENSSQQDINNMLINLNRFQLNRKDHIKKYNKLRKLHSEIIDNMEKYIEEGKYNVEKYYEYISKDIQKEINLFEFSLDSYDEDDITILNELFMYKNHSKLPSITEIYLDKNKFRSKEKIKMLNSMKNSYVSLFKVIDVGMSSTLRVDKKRMIYVYNRIITFDEISFGTGIHCMMTSNHKQLKEFIKTHKYNKCSDFSRCILLYNLSKNDNDLTVTYNNQYGSRR